MRDIAGKKAKRAGRRRKYTTAAATLLTVHVKLVMKKRLGIYLERCVFTLVDRGTEVMEATDKYLVTLLISSRGRIGREMNCKIYIVRCMYSVFTHMTGSSYFRFRW